MTSVYPAVMRRLINELTKLPTIGERSATRLAYHLLTRDPSESRRLAQAIEAAVGAVRLCDVCHFLTESERCSICSDPHRDATVLCVVEKPADIFALERSGGYRGLYHVLHGVWSPLKGLGPEQTKLSELLRRLEQREARFAAGQDPLSPELKELIIATGTTVEGDATALYIANAVAGLPVAVSRIAQGLPKGGELEYADDLTLSLSLEGRRKL